MFYQRGFQSNHPFNHTIDWHRNSFFFANYYNRKMNNNFVKFQTILSSNLLDLSLSHPISHPNSCSKSSLIIWPSNKTIEHKSINKLWITIVNLLCLITFAYYFNDLCSLLFQTETNLILVSISSRNFPNPVFCTNYYNPAEFEQLKIQTSVRFSDGNTSTAMTIEGDLWLNRKHCFYFRPKIWSATGYIVYRIENLNFPILVGWWTWSLNEVINRELMIDVDINYHGKVVELASVEISTQNTWRSPCVELNANFDQQILTKPNTSLPIVSGNLIIDNQTYSSTSILPCTVNSYFNSRLLPSYHNPDLMTLDHNEIAFQIQNPVLRFERRLLLNTANFIWFNSQLLCTFFGLTLYTALYRSIDCSIKIVQKINQKRRAFHRSKFVCISSPSSLQKLVLLFSSLIFVVQFIELSNEFFVRNLRQNSHLRVETYKIPDYAVSVCFSLNHTSSNQEDVTIQDQLSESLQLKHLMKEFISSKHLGFYFRHRKICFNSLIQSARPRRKAMTSIETEVIYGQLAFKAEFDSNCTALNCFQV